MPSQQDSPVFQERPTPGLMPGVGLSQHIVCSVSSISLKPTAEGAAIRRPSAAPDFDSIIAARCALGDHASRPADAGSLLLRA